MPDIKGTAAIQAKNSMFTSGKMKVSIDYIKKLIGDEGISE
jgi:hypothetical protein